jgi:hypothetical protein
MARNIKFFKTNNYMHNCLDLIPDSCVFFCLIRIISARFSSNKSLGKRDSEQLRALRMFLHI